MNIREYLPNEIVGILMGILTRDQKDRLAKMDRLAARVKANNVDRPFFTAAQMGTLKELGGLDEKTVELISRIDLIGFIEFGSELSEEQREAFVTILDEGQGLRLFYALYAW